MKDISFPRKKWKGSGEERRNWVSGEKAQDSMRMRILGEDI